MRLIHKDGREARVGDVVFSFRGEPATIEAIYPPKQPGGTTGRVQTPLGLHYPSVYDLEWDFRKVIGPMDV